MDRSAPPAQKARIAVIEQHLQVEKGTITYTPFGNRIVDGELIYTVPVPEDLTAKSWEVRRHPKEVTTLRLGYDPPYDGIGTAYDIFETALSANPEAPFLGTRETLSDGRPGKYIWMTYREAARRRTAIGSALLELGLRKGSKVGLCSVNCRDWMLVDLACHAYSMVTVPLYDTLGPDAVDHILGHADVEAVACSAAVLPSVLQCLPKQSHVKLVIVYNLDAGKGLPRSDGNHTAQLLTLEDTIQIGMKGLKGHLPPAPQDLALLCYTSGTTGLPKGAMISHRNLTCTGASQASIPALEIRPGDIHISYLPLAHIYERANITAMIHGGAAIGFYRGDILTLLDDIQELRPTIFASVPRLYNRIFDKVMWTIQSGNVASRLIFNTAYNSSRAALLSGDLSGGRLGPLWDKLVFSKVRDRLGGRVRLMGSGSAPLSKDVMDFLRICFGCTVIEGYGLTETTSCCSATYPEETRASHVGGVANTCELKLEDIPDMKYTNADVPNPRGEICVRGPQVFMGYYKDEKNTSEALDAKGWLHTGDVGEWLSGGRLKIIDRKKAMFKLSQGEYIAAEKIENIVTRSPFVSQAFVYGDSLQSKLVAILVPDPEVLIPWASARSLGQELDQLCSLQAVQRAVFQSVTEESQNAELRGFEQVAAIHLCHKPFSIENGLQTPTFKLKRQQAKQHFQSEIDLLYSTLQDSK